MNRGLDLTPTLAPGERVPEGRVRGFVWVHGPTSQFWNRGSYP